MTNPTDTRNFLQRSLPASSLSPLTIQNLCQCPPNSAGLPPQCRTPTPGLSSASELPSSSTIGAVARLFARNSCAEISPDRPHAEFWMGTHESGPSFVVEGDDGPVSVSVADEKRVTLKDWIEKNPNALGRKIVDKWACDVPFLFKELKDVLYEVPEIVDMTGRVEAKQFLNINKNDGGEKIKSALRLLFAQLMSASKEMTAKAISKLKSRLYRESQVRRLTEKEQLVLQLEKQYPADIGVISAFFLNYVKLNPGEALYLGANEPHAYLSGECVECMATSDNVVRAGLTPKHGDVPTLCSMLTYKQGHPEILRGFPLSPCITRYLPPFDEFEVDSCSLPRGASTVFPPIAGPIFLVLSGEGILQTGSSEDVVAEGDVLFAAAETQISMSTSTELKLYRAGVSSRFLTLFIR